MESKSGFMKDTQILSAFQEMPAAPDSRPADAAPLEPALVFDACQTGVVLRAVLFVEVCVGVGVAFGAGDVLDWVVRLSLVTGAALPGALAWLLLACLTKRLLAKLVPAVQYTVAVFLGAVAGLYGCALLAWTGLLVGPPWAARVRHIPL